MVASRRGPDTQTRTVTGPAVLVGVAGGLAQLVDQRVDGVRVEGRVVGGLA